MARSHGRSLAGGVAVAALLSGVVAPPAQAEVERFTDADDTTAGADLLAVKVNNGAKRLKLRLKFDDLVKTSQVLSQSTTIYLDTRKGRRGPEYGFGAGLNDGTDYQLVAVRGWEYVGEPLNCDYDLVLDWAADTAKVIIDQACLGDRPQVRVAVDAMETLGRRVPEHDWLGEPRSFTPWVRRG